MAKKNVISVLQTFTLHINSVWYTESHFISINVHSYFFSISFTLEVKTVSSSHAFIEFIYFTIIIIIIIIIILVITLTQGVYIYIPEQTMFVGYIVLQLFCVYSLCFM